MRVKTGWQDELERVFQAMREVGVEAAQGGRTSWSEYVASVPDPRRQSVLTQHLLSDILALALCAMLCGAADLVGMALFCQERLVFLTEKLGFWLAHGVPAHDTFTRVFACVDPQALERCLLGW